MRLLWALLATALLGADPVPPPAPAAAPVPGAVPVPAAVPAPAPASAPLERLRVQALAYVQAQVEGREGAYVFKVVGTSVLPRPPRGEDLSFEPAHLSRLELTGRFFASFSIRAGERNLGMARVDLEGVWVGRLLRLRSAVGRREVPREDQLEAFDFRGTPPAGALAALPAGQRLRMAQAQGHVLVRTDLEAVPLINVGEPVRLEMVDGALTITVDAVARSSGGAGEKVRLEMPSTHRMVQAVVIGAGEARVQWAAAK